MDRQFDIIIIGAGIAGVSLGARAAPQARVAILEMEERAAYHTTGRSAATYDPNYGPPAMVALTRASADFFYNPPQGFAEAPLISPRGSLFLEAEGQAKFTQQILSGGAVLEEISEARAREICPVLKAGYAKRSFLDIKTADMDVDLLHRGFLRMFKAAGGETLLNAEAKTIERSEGQWHITTPEGKFSAAIIVNAAGAWGDVVAARAGVKPIGLIPKRRSIGVIPVAVAGFEHWPMVGDVGETWYAKPQSGKLLVSSADATPVEPHDAYADDMAVAEGIEHLMNATTIEVTQLEHSWGGLRTFAPDGSPVIGFDPEQDGFFWLVGQGGYGIQSAPALSQAANALLFSQALPQYIVDVGLRNADISPNRFR